MSGDLTLKIWYWIIPEVVDVFVIPLSPGLSVWALHVDSGSSVELVWWCCRFPGVIRVIFTHPLIIISCHRRGWAQVHRSQEQMSLFPEPLLFSFSTFSILGPKIKASLLCLTSVFEENRSAWAQLVKTPCEELITQQLEVRRDAVCKPVCEYVLGYAGIGCSAGQLITFQPRLGWVEPNVLFPLWTQRQNSALIHCLIDV